MKELIKKILREEVQKRFTKSNQSFERLIIKQMESLISETNRVVVPPDDNYGNYMQYVKEDIVNTFENLNIYILQTRKYGGGYYYSDILAVHKNDNDILNQILEYEVNSAY